MKALQELVQGRNKTDRAVMLDEIVDYVKFLRLQVKPIRRSWRCCPTVCRCPEPLIEVGCIKNFQSPMQPLQTHNSSNMLSLAAFNGRYHGQRAKYTSVGDMDLGRHGTGSGQAHGGRCRGRDAVPSVQGTMHHALTPRVGDLPS
ncbi:hypothetical protein MLD38_018621 [Melastoma candidum]|uniref:Uncharacterized protein n=1 Tax=Melastoma candidum TaxID=119954 RepID=A0ACB9QVG6_9MYRT|nr:hypothetical protein MLD38_018621 [Melastoma candidum]